MHFARKYYRRFAAAMILLSFMAGMPHKANAQNFPPFAKATPMPEVVFLGQAIVFSSAESLDPDEGPQPLSLLWDFGDGATSTAANPSHTYTNVGAYRVSLTVSDGADAAIDTVVVHVLAPPTEKPPSKSSLLVLSQSETELWVANPDSDSVSVLAVTTNSLSKLIEIPVGRQPRMLAFSRDGARVVVACQGTNELWVLNAAGRSVTGRIPVGHQPYGVAVSPSDGTILVSNQGDGTVSVISLALVVKKILRVTEGPRAVAITADGTRAYVTHFLTHGEAGSMTEISLDTLTSPSPLPKGRGQGEGLRDDAQAAEEFPLTPALSPAGICLAECARPRAQRAGALVRFREAPVRWKGGRCCGRGRPHSGR